MSLGGYPAQRVALKHPGRRVLRGSFWASDAPDLNLAIRANEAGAQSRAM